jgi:3-oxoacyl-[acyl-carrier protein] reductase
MRLAGRTAIITGAAGGLGSAIARRFVTEGASVCLVDLIDTKAVAATLKTLNAAEPKCQTITNVSDSSAVANMVTQAQQALGKIDILVNVAGISSHGSSDQVTEEVWDRVIDTNLKSVFLCCKAVLPLMRKQGYGRIVNIGSVLGKNGGNPRPWIDKGEQAKAGSLAYGASKAGVHALTLYLAKENASDGITVNAVAPGPIATAMTSNFPETLRNLMPVGRMGTPEDVADAVTYLAGEAASFVTGEILDVNGGLWGD